MNRSKWLELREHLDRMYVDEVRMFTDRRLRELEHILSGTNKELAARRLAIELENAPLAGDLLIEVARRFEEVLEVPIPVQARNDVQAHHLDRWVTAPEATTMDLP